jgi:hypothetical protein
LKHFQTLRDEAADMRRILNRDLESCKDAYWMVKEEKRRVDPDAIGANGR